MRLVLPALALIPVFPAAAGATYCGAGVDKTSRARVRHATDTVLDPRARVLRYGRKTDFRRLRCRSRRSGITCRSRVSGHGFTVSVEKRTLF